MKIENCKLKIAIGMSGGVDSSVAAFLLKKEGFQPIGIFMNVMYDWQFPNSEFLIPNKYPISKLKKIPNLYDAYLVAKKLDIPFYVVDAREQFKNDVTDYFIDEYKNCRTPNPCVVCNEKVKFGWLLDYAEKLGCDFLATGHYARIVASSQEPGVRGNRLISYSILKGRDDSRDQSYFLYRLNQEQLSKILFPVGDMEKSKVREIARQNDLPVFQKAESREICFVADDYRKFLQRYLPADSFKSGDIVDTRGNVIGKHEGLSRYTVGQRKGIEQSQKSKGKRQNHNSKLQIDQKPLYVIRLDKEKNQLVVGEDAALFKDEFEIENAHFFLSSQELGASSQQLTVKIRYQAEAVPCSIRPDHDSLFIIHTSVPVRALTPGQSAVIYDGDEVVGGGIIAS